MEKNIQLKESDSNIKVYPITKAKNVEGLNEMISQQTSPIIEKIEENAIKVTEDDFSVKEMFIEDTEEINIYTKEQIDEKLYQTKLDIFKRVKDFEISAYSAKDILDYQKNNIRKIRLENNITIDSSMAQYGYPNTNWPAAIILNEECSLIGKEPQTTIIVKNINNNTTGGIQFIMKNPSSERCELKNIYLQGDNSSIGLGTAGIVNSNIFIDNITIDGFIYAIRFSNEFNNYYPEIIIQNSTLNGFNSMTRTNTSFRSCVFGESKNYKAFNIYIGNYIFDGCTFCDGYEMEVISTEANVIFSSCSLNEEPLTRDNISKLVVNGTEYCQVY